MFFGAAMLTWVTWSFGERHVCGELAFCSHSKIQVAMLALQPDRN